MPRLVYPFTLVGAAAGWLSAELLDNPLLDFTASHGGALAALCSGAIGAALGLLLQKRCEPREAFVTTHAMWVLLAIAVLFGGAVSGGLTGAIMFANERGFTSGILAGLGAGLAFLPVCALVVAAARRAARARLGSLVAAADRRELWALMLAALAVTTAAGFPDWMAGRAAIVAVALAAASFVAIAALLAADRRAAAAVREAARSADLMELRERDAEEAEGAVPAVDLGLGDEVRAQMARSAAAYRGRDRTASLLVGSLDEARAAVRQATGRKIAALAVACFVLAGHALSTRPRANILYLEALCDRGSAVACGIAAAKLREMGDLDDLVRAVILGTHACEAFSPPDTRGCVAAAEAIERDPSRSDRATRQRYRERACFAGDAPSCRMSEEKILFSAASAWRHAALLQRGCEAGDMAACEEAVEMRARASKLELAR